jgi:hypothetical protein
MTFFLPLTNFFFISMYELHKVRGLIVVVPYIHTMYCNHVQPLVSPLKLYLAFEIEQVWFLLTKYSSKFQKGEEGEEEGVSRTEILDHPLMGGHLSFSKFLWQVL